MFNNEINDETADGMIIITLFSVDAVGFDGFAVFFATPSPLFNGFVVEDLGIISTNRVCASLPICEKEV